MEIIYKRPDELIEYEGNARRNDAGVAKVAESIKEFGFLNPITIDENNVIISGHTRLKAARQLGLTEVPCSICPRRMRSWPASSTTRAMSIPPGMSASSIRSWRASTSMSRPRSSPRIGTGSSSRRTRC